jgi:hypothetical protein
VDALSEYDEINLVDFEFPQRDGERIPPPLCMTRKEWRSGHVDRYWGDELAKLRSPPFGVGPRSVLVAYYASAEVGCFRALGWQTPANILDLFAEFARETSGLPVPCGRRLPGALFHHGLDGVSVTEKDSMISLILRGHPYSPEERRSIQDYNEADVQALDNLLRVMLPRIDLPRALFRGRFMASLAAIEDNGIPIDTEANDTLCEYWTDIQDQLIERIDAGRGIYNGRTFKQEMFAKYLAEQGIPWPVLPSGSLSLSKETFRAMSKVYPEQIAPIGELRNSLSQLRLDGLTIGHDRRNRCLLGAFQSKTGRCQPSSNKYLFGESVWRRGLCRPEPETGLAYCDFKSQEFRLAAALSNDETMLRACRTDDPYIFFGKLTQMIPPDGTAETHGTIREMLKRLCLGIQYGMGYRTLAEYLGVSLARGRELLQLYRETFPTYWKWSDAVETTAYLNGTLTATFGWSTHLGPQANPRSARNFPLQGNGSEMLRLTCIMTVEQGIKVCATVHDAILVEAPLKELKSVVAQTQAIMRKASELVIPNLPIPVDAKLIPWPQRYSDKRGEVMWNTVWQLIREHKQGPRTARGEGPWTTPNRGRARTPRPVLLMFLVLVVHLLPISGPWQTEKSTWKNTAPRHGWLARPNLENAHSGTAVGNSFPDQSRGSGS